VDSEKPIAVRERLGEGPRDNYGRVGGGLVCPGDEPGKNEMASLQTHTARNARLGHVMVCIPWCSNTQVRPPRARGVVGWRLRDYG